MNFLYVHELLLKLIFLSMPFVGSWYWTKVSIGGLGTHAAFYFLLCGIILLGIDIFYRGLKIKINRCVKILLIFFLILIISGLVNMPNMITMHTKGQFGEFRFVKIIGMIYGIVSAVYIYNLLDDLKKDKLILKYINVSLGIAIIYSIIEIISVFFGVPVFINIFDTMENIMRAGNLQDTMFIKRIHSVAMEPSYLAMYLSVVFPWTAILIFGRRKWIGWILFTSIYILTFFTLSRTAYVIILVESVIVFLFFKRDIKEIYFSSKEKTAFFLIVVFGTFIILLIVINNMIETAMQGININIDIVSVFLSLIDGDSGGYGQGSNISRYGSQVAAWNLFLDNPFIGVGYAQFPFYASSYYPDWAYASYEIKIWADGTDASSIGGWGGTYNQYLRLLAENGLLGSLVWLAFLLSLLIRGIKKIKKTINEDELMMCKASLVGFIGLLLSGLNSDALIDMPLFWINIGIYWHLFYRKK